MSQLTKRDAGIPEHGEIIHNHSISVRNEARLLRTRTGELAPLSEAIAAEREQAIWYPQTEFRCYAAATAEGIVLYHAKPAHPDTCEAHDNEWRINPTLLGTVLAGRMPTVTEPGEAVNAIMTIRELLDRFGDRPIILFRLDQIARLREVAALQVQPPDRLAQRVYVTAFDDGLVDVFRLYQSPAGCDLPAEMIGHLPPAELAEELLREALKKETS
jgi:hypothetical protein